MRPIPAHKLFWLLLCGIFPLLNPAFAQAPEGSSAPIVSEIRIEFQGFQNVSTENVLAHISVKGGQPLDQNAIDQSLRSLYRSGNYEFIDIARQPQPDGSVVLIFRVLPKLRVSAVRFEGLKEVDRDDLEDEIATSVGLPLDEQQVKRDSVAIFDYLQEDGYTNAVVEYSIVRNEEQGSAEVVFEVDEGERLQIDDIIFRGNESIDSDDLEDELETSEYIPIWSWITGGGRLQQDVFREDLEKLRTYYQNQGFLDVEIPESEVLLEYPKEGELNIVINITEGRRYTLGEVSFAENELFSDEELRGTLGIEAGEFFSPAKVDQAVQNLKDYYGEVGYLDTFVRVERDPNLETGEIAVRFVISESEPFTVESINLQGNTKTKSEVIIRELALAPGDTFDLVRMKASEARLRNTGFFESVNLSPEATNLPNRRNLRINVKEANTGNLTFGAGFSSVEQLVGFVELTQGNFDITNWRNGFQGGGQKFRLRLSIGSRSNQVLISFEEPWLWQRRVAGGIDLYRTQTNFLSTLYNELRMGFEVYLRKRLFEVVEGRLSYTLEQVEISDVDSDAPDEVQEEEGARLVSKLGFTLLRDTRDRFIFPTRGSRLQSISNFAGPFPGETDYLQQEFRATGWFLIFEDWEQVFSVNTRAGTIIPYSGQRVPFFDRYFLGGPNSLRGFGFREVGPKDSDGDEIGGNSFAFAQLEYTVRPVEPLGVAAFYDIGFVNSGDLDFDPSSYNDNWGLGLRLLLLGSPLNIDFGFPITTDEFNDDGFEFNFSFGTTF